MVVRKNNIKKNDVDLADNVNVEVGVFVYEYVVKHSHKYYPQMNFLEYLKNI